MFWDILKAKFPKILLFVRTLLIVLEKVKTFLKNNHEKHGLIYCGSRHKLICKFVYC